MKPWRCNKDVRVSAAVDSPSGTSDEHRTNLVWTDAVPPALDPLQSLLIRRLLLGHDVSDDDRGTKRDTSVAVDEDGSSLGDGLVDEEAGSERLEGSEDGQLSPKMERRNSKDGLREDSDEILIL